MAHLALIESVEGIGRRTALTLLIGVPELGELSRGQAACLLRLAPFDHDSGTRKGHPPHRGQARQRATRALRRSSASQLPLERRTAAALS
ncbi:transposase [Methylobacterium gnaphalii]